MSIRNLIRQVAIELVETGEAITASDVVALAQTRHPVEFASEATRLADSAALREAKEIFRSLSEDDDSPQMALPGLDLPSVIAIPVEDRFVYRSTASCTWAELEAGESVRHNNVKAAVAKLDSYRENLDILRPIMEGTNLTAAQAAEILAGRELGDAA